MYWNCFLFLHKQKHQNRMNLRHRYTVCVCVCVYLRICRDLLAQIKIIKLLVVGFAPLCTNTATTATEEETRDNDSRRWRNFIQNWLPYTLYFFFIQSWLQNSSFHWLLLLFCLYISLWSLFFLIFFCLFFSRICFTLVIGLFFLLIVIDAGMHTF